MNMRLGIGLGLSSRGAAGSAPAWGTIRQALFANSEPGGLYQVHPDYCRQGDTEGSSAAAIDAVVGWLQDQSGNGQHLTQSTTAAKPILRSDGTLYWLEFDGTDDVMTAGTVDATTVMLAAAAQFVNSSIGDVITAGDDGNDSGIAAFGTGGGGLRFRHLTGGVSTGISGAWLADPFVAVGRADGAADEFRVNDTAYSGTTLGGTGAFIQVGNGAGAGFAEMQFSGGLVRGGVASTDNERDAVQTWLASLQGRVL